MRESEKVVALVRVYLQRQECKKRSQQFAVVTHTHTHTFAVAMAEAAASSSSTKRPPPDAVFDRAGAIRDALARINARDRSKDPKLAGMSEAEKDEHFLQSAYIMADVKEAVWRSGKTLSVDTLIKCAELEVARRYKEESKAVSSSSSSSRDGLTTKELNKLRKLDAAEAMAQEKQQEEFKAKELARMGAEGKRQLARQQAKIAQLHVAWFSLTTATHEKRRQDRVRMLMQFVRFRSQHLFALAREQYENGVLKINSRTLRIMPELVAETKQAFVDPDTGFNRPARLSEPHTPLYLEIECPAESQFEGDCNFIMNRVKARSLPHLEKELEAHHGVEAADGLLRDLIRQVKSYDPDDSFIVKLCVNCDSLRPDTQACSRFAVFRVARFEDRGEENHAKIAAMGPLKVKPHVCGSCTGFILLDPARAGKCGMCDAVPLFCSPACKRAHRRNVHGADNAMGRNKAQKRKLKAEARAKQEERKKAVAAVGIQLGARFHQDGRDRHDMMLWTEQERAVHEERVQRKVLSDERARNARPWDLSRDRGLLGL